MLSIAPMEVCALYFGATILLLDITKIINNKFPLTSLNIKLWVSKFSLATVKFHVKWCVDFLCWVLLRKEKNWLILPVTLTHTHSDLSPQRFFFYQSKAIRFRSLLKWFNLMNIYVKYHVYFYPINRSFVIYI